MLDCLYGLNQVYLRNGQVNNFGGSIYLAGDDTHLSCNFNFKCGNATNNIKVFIFIEKTLKTILGASL